MNYSLIFPKKKNTTHNFSCCWILVK